VRSQNGVVDLTLDVRLAIALVVAAVLGGLIGAERDLHAHPAGTRTHLLVCVGCALFTELSIYGFLGGPAGTAPVDPSRVAAQILTGIGFLGAGAILKYGTAVRGLTTAASLWATAAIGIAAGTQQYWLALVATALVLFSLWPLSRISHWLRRRNGERLVLRAVVTRLEGIGAIAGVLREHEIAIDGLRSQRHADGGFDLDLTLRLPAGTTAERAIAEVAGVPEVRVLEGDRGVE